MLAVFLQAFVVQTHVHAMTQGAAGIELSQAPDEQHATAGAEHALSCSLCQAPDEQHATAGAEHALSCSLCQALSTHGAAPVPGGTSALALERTSEAAIVALARAPRAISHAWRSRAPPAYL